MIPVPLQVIVFELLGAVSTLLDIAGLVICIRYLRLSTAMPLLVIAFAGSAGGSIISHAATYAVRFEILPQDFATGVYTVAFMLSVAGKAALVIGLLLVFRDMRERFQFLREVHESTRDRVPTDEPSDR